MIANNLTYSRKAEAGSGDASRKERFEDSPRNTLIEAAPVVADGYAGITSGREFAVAHSTLAGQLLLPGCYANTTTAIHRLRGIGAQIEDDLLQLRGLARDSDVDRNIFNDQIDLRRQGDTQK
jgi:hypothetical protein